MSRIDTFRIVRGRGGSLGPALFLATAALGLAAASCGPDGPGPVSEPVQDPAPPVVMDSAGVTVATLGDAPERLHLYREAPASHARLLFLGGRAAAPLPDGRTAWPDADGARVILFGGGGTVDGVLQGSAPDGTRLQQPAFATVGSDAILAVEADGGTMAFQGGVPRTWSDPDGTGARGAGTRELGVSARAVFDIPMQLLPGNAPLFWLHPAEGEPIPVDRAWRGEVPLLDGLHSSGWTAADGRGGVYFAGAAKAEIRGHDQEGTLRWISRWAPRRDVKDPRFKLDDGALAPDFTLVHQGMALGPDGHLYLLAPEEGDGPGEAALLVLDPTDGLLLRRGSVPADAAIYVGRGGHIWVADAAEALSRTGRAERVAFEPFTLPDLDGEGEIDLADYRGRVVVLNFWASWCVPCRQEIPLLDDLAHRLPPEAVVLGLNEDVRPRDGVAFLEELGGIGYASAAGRGEQQQRYQYRGLPYTVVLDREGRMVRSFYGFGSSIDPIEEVVRSELALGGVGPG